MTLKLVFLALTVLNIQSIQFTRNGRDTVLLGKCLYADQPCAPHTFCMNSSIVTCWAVTPDGKVCK